MISIISTTIVYLFFALLISVLLFPRELLEAVRSTYEDIFRRRENLKRKFHAEEKRLQQEAEEDYQRIKAHGPTLRDWLRLPLVLAEMVLSYPIGGLIGVGERYNAWVEQETEWFDGMRELDES